MSIHLTQALLYRTDFSDDEAWRAVLDSVRKQSLDESRLRIVDDRSTFDGLTAETLLRAGIGMGRPMLFLADAETMRGGGALLCVDMAGSRRRVAATEIAQVLSRAPSGLLAIAQMLGKMIEVSDGGIRLRADSPWGPGEVGADIDEPSKLVRTDFSSDRAWQETIEIIRASATEDFTFAELAIVDDSRFDGMRPADLSRDELGQDVVTLYIADARTMTDPDHPIICVDDEGSEFRCSAKELLGVVVNLSIGNVDFFELADAVDADGIYRGP